MLPYPHRKSNGRALPERPAPPIIVCFALLLEVVLLKPLLSFAALVIFVSLAGAADKLELKDGDRVVLLGNTLIEREQRHGYWELALTIAYPDKNITFRNLGWSGDTVWGEEIGRAHV